MRLLKIAVTAICLLGSWVWLSQWDFPRGIVNRAENSLLKKAEVATPLEKQKQLVDENPPSPDPIEPLQDKWLSGIGATKTEKDIIRAYYSTGFLERYHSLLEAARGENSDAQYLLAKLYEECSRFLSEESLRTIRANGYFSDQEFADLVEDNSRCSDVRKLTKSNDESKDAVNHWLQRASALDNPIATYEVNQKRFQQQYSERTSNLIAKNIRSYGNPPFDMDAIMKESRKLTEADIIEIENLRKELLDSIEYARRDPLLFQNALRQGLYYYSRHVEDDLHEKAHIDQSKELDKRLSISEAWRLIHCTYEPNCDETDYLHRYREIYFEYERDEILEQASVMTLAIRESNWETLGLEQTK